MFDSEGGTRTADAWWEPCRAADFSGPALVELAITDPVSTVFAATDPRAATEMLVAAHRAAAQAHGLRLSMVHAIASSRRAEFARDAAAQRAAGRPVMLDPQHPVDRDALDKMIGDEVAAALRLAPRAGYQDLLLADALVERAPLTFAALCRGDLDLTRASRIADAVALLPVHQAHQVEEQVLPDAGRLTAARLATLLARAVHAADPAEADARYESRLRTRCARVRPEGDGIASLRVLGRADHISAAWQTATAVAQHRLQQQRDRDAGQGGAVGDVRDRLTLEQARADAIIELLTHPEGLPGTQRMPAPDVHVHLVLPAGELRDNAAEIPGHGPLPDSLTRALLTPTRPPGSPDPLVTFTRWLTDADGVVTATGSTRYRPPAALQRLIRARDSHCRFPGCSRLAEHADLDHTVPWPRGRTEQGNLASLCRHHHRLKTHTRWRLRQDRDGILTWTSPSGHDYTTRPPRWLRSTRGIPGPREPLGPDDPPPF